MAPAWDRRLPDPCVAGFVIRLRSSGHGRKAFFQPFAPGQTFRQIRKALLDLALPVRPALLRPRLLPAEKVHIDEAYDERLDRIQRGEHPGGRTGLAGFVGRKESRAPAADVQDDRA